MPLTRMMVHEVSLRLPAASTGPPKSRALVRIRYDLPTAVLSPSRPIAPRYGVLGCGGRITGLVCNRVSWSGRASDHEAWGLKR